MADGEPAAPAVAPAPGDLGARTASAVVMVAVAGAALWLGGLVWLIFVALVAAAVLWEWTRLAQAIAGSPLALALWFIAGVGYIGVAAAMLWHLDFYGVLIVILCVAATDIGAYFAGRTFGGRRIAPRISPGKTWAGLAGGMLAAALMFWAMLAWAAWRASVHHPAFVLPLHDAATIATELLTGAIIAVVAQSGDFFESWMKRRAGVKDSGRLIPGHGGVFDRVDGLLAVLFVAGILVRLRSWL